MDMKRKLEIAQQAIRMIAQADDTDSALRSAALDRLSSFIDSERAASKERLDAKFAEHDEVETAPKKGK